MSFGSGGFGGFGSNNNTTNTSTGFGGFGSNNATSGGFGANTNTNTGGGFGSANTGGGLFGGGGNTSNTGGFGSTAGGFGSANTTSAFGGAAKPAFGASPSGGLFGSTANTTTNSGGFGGGGFGSNNTAASTSSPFGGAANTGGGLFGSNNAAKPAFGAGATTGTTGGLFGGGSAATPSTGFGGGSFGAPASTALGGNLGEAPGTAATAFQPLVEKENATGSAQNSFQNILFQDPYKKWSAEELRLQDYNSQRRYGSGGGGGFGSGGSTFGSTGFGSNAATTSGFGSNNTATTGGGLFGSANNNATSTGFGAQNNTNTGFGSTGGSGLFGAAKPATGGLFGSTPSAAPAASTGGGLFGGGGGTGFGANTSNTSGGFGAANNTAGGGLFGGNNAAQAKPSGFSFGNTANNTNTASTGFGANNNTTGAFGSNTGGTGAFGNAQTNTGGGGLFGNAANTQQSTGGAFGSNTGGFGQQNNQQQSGGLFGNQQKPATGGGVFGSAATPSTNTGGGLFGNANTNTNTGFGASAQAPSGGGLFGGAKPATGGGLFGNAAPAQNNTQGGGLFGGLNNQNQQQTQQPQTGGGLFGGLNQSQPKPGGLFGASTQPAGGSVFGNTQNQQQGGLFGNSQGQQQPQGGLGSSLFGGASTQSQNQPQALTASVNDPTAFGATSLFSNLPTQSNDPGPLATPLSSKSTTRRPSVLPIYKLNPAAGSRFNTPQKRGFGFSYSTYGTPTSPSSASSTPGAGSQGLLTGSLTRSLGKSISTSNLRRSYNVDDSLLAPGAFSASTSSRMFGNNNVKKLVINRELRTDLFSTPTKDKSPQDTPNGSRKLAKRVSFDTSNGEAAESGDAQNGNAEQSSNNGYIRPNGVNGARSSPLCSEMEQVTGKELAIVHEEEPAASSAPVSTDTLSDREPGEYWMKPSKEEIDNMNRVQRQKVVDLTVGRVNCGWVKFKVPVDLNTVDYGNLFENIVVFVVRSCTVYPNQAKKPAVGKGLNVPSLINLESSYPRASMTSKGRKGPSLAKHVDRLKRISGTKFENYNTETGEWTFSVEHFTTYGLDYDDEEGAETDPSAEMSGVEHHRAQLEPDFSAAEYDEEDSFELRRRERALPGAFDSDVAVDDDEVPEMAEAGNYRSSFLGDRSAGSKSRSLVPVGQDDLDEEYAMSEDQDAGASLRHHLAAEQEDDSLSVGDSHLDFVQETPAGIMRARMRAIKESATPVKVQVAAGDDWMDMLQKTISPRKRDRVHLKSQREAGSYGKESVLDVKSPSKKRVVSDSKGFATSIDLMKSIFDQAKAPAEVVQPSVRPQNVKWPYKRTTKTLDASDMDDKERQWHSVPRPNWGPSGTLVFAGTPEDTPFGRSGRVIEKNGLMTVMKGAIVSSSQDIRIAKFTNEMSAKALQAHADLTEIYLDGGVPTVMGPRVSIREFATETGSKNAAAEHEKLVWELASVLFDSIKVPSDMQNDPDAADRIRRENLSKFWEQMLDEETNKGISMARTSEEKALASLAGHRIAEACKHLLDGKDFRLATLVALIGSSDAMKKDMREQIKEWKDAHVLPELSQPLRALYEMLSGNVCACEGGKNVSTENRMKSFVISKEFGLNWRQAFGLRLWYAISAEDFVADAVEKYQGDVSQEKEIPPMTWFTEQGIRSIWNDPEGQRQDLIWGLLQLYSNDRADLEAILRPENSQLSPLDYRLCWQLGQALTATGKVSFGKNADEKADAATTSFASQLTTEGSWEEAAFILLHLTDPNARTKAIQEHLCRHAGLIGNEQSESFKKLTEKLKVPTRWIWHAKALYMRSVKKDASSEVQCLLRADSFAEAHRTFIKDVAPVAIIERDFHALADLLRQFDGRQSQVPDWNLGGEIYKAFLQLVDYQNRHEQPPNALVNGLLEGLPAMHGNTPEAGIQEYAALTDMAAVVASVVGDMAKLGQMDHQRILKLPLTEDVLLRHSRNLAWSHYHAIMAGH
ncbi:hypothetical protein PG993_005238 [Apiospora rasikravindrae]|uniref:Peptidase S59 domain-containing protein n=1 Tax=Apiospora rasikravindrae TaxID=990691 RepID=A0ABR1THJ6_9PEZI